MKLILTFLTVVVVSQGFSQSECLTTSCWFYSRNTPQGYLPPDGTFTFDSNGSFIFKNYLTGNTHGGNWDMPNSTDVLLHYTSSTSGKLNSDHTLNLLDCGSLLNTSTLFIKMDQINFIDSKVILTPEGYPWQIYCNGQLMN